MEVEVHQEQRHHRGLSHQDGNDFETCVRLQELWKLPA